jgi:hypothetical protein
VTSVAYRAKPPSPGWLWTAGGLLVGWIVAATATGVLYLFADSVGAISRTYPSLNDWATPDNGIAINEWPYPDNGLWSLLTNVAVVLLVLVVTTVATSWWMRRSYDRFSEGRLALTSSLSWGTVGDPTPALRADQHVSPDRLERGATEADHRAPRPAPSPSELGGHSRTLAQATVYSVRIRRLSRCRAAVSPALITTRLTCRTGA